MKRGLGRTPVHATSTYSADDNDAASHSMSPAPLSLTLARSLARLLAQPSAPISTEQTREHSTYSITLMHIGSVCMFASVRLFLSFLSVCVLKILYLYLYVCISVYLYVEERIRKKEKRWNTIKYKSGNSHVCTYVCALTYIRVSRPRDTQGRCNHDPPPPPFIVILPPPPFSRHSL